MKKINSHHLEIYLGDCLNELKNIEDDSIQLIFTSPPYADQRKNTYGGVHPDEYVAWFLPIASELLRVLKPNGTFVLNIKERVVNGERHTYVLELIQALRQQGWLWTEEFIWHKKNPTPVNGPTASAIHGNGFCSSIKPVSSICIRKKLCYPSVIGLKHAFLI